MSQMITAETKRTVLQVSGLHDADLLGSGETWVYALDGDYFPKNVLITNNLEVSGIIDFSSRTAVGDPLAEHNPIDFLRVIESTGGNLYLSG